MNVVNNQNISMTISQHLDSCPRRPAEIKMRYKRETLQDMTRPLKQWLYKNKNNPYPTKGQKVELAEQSKMTLTQVSNWFANARRRLKNTVRGNELSWERRVSMYNDCVKGNQESMDISDDSAWESGEDDMRDIQSPRESIEQALESAILDDSHLSSPSQPTSETSQPTLETSQPTLETSQPTSQSSTVTSPQIKPIESPMETFSRHIEHVLEQELASPLPRDEPISVLNKQSQDGSILPEVKCEPVTEIKQEPVTEQFPVSPQSTSYSLTNIPTPRDDKSSVITSNCNPLNLPNPITSYMCQPMKSEHAPVAPPTNETIASSITNQIATYLMATQALGAYGMNPFGQVPFLTPQMQEEARQHVALMQAHALEMRKQQEVKMATGMNVNTVSASDNRTGSPLSSETSQSSQTVSQSSSQSINSDSQISFSNPFTPLTSRTHAEADDVTQDTHEMTPSPANSDDMAYPKADTPKFKNTLLQRYLQGDNKVIYHHPTETSPSHVTTAPLHPVEGQGHSVIQHQHSFSPLDLRKRVRNLSGSMGSQEYEDISDCDPSDVASSGLTSPGYVSRDVSDVMSYKGNVFDDLAKRWREVNQGTAPPTKEEEENDDLMMKEVSAIFTLANLASSRNKATP